MITTTYKCDRCGHEQADSYENPRQLVRVSVNYGHMIGNYSANYSVAAERLWCRPCCDELNIVMKTKERDWKAETPFPTFEDQLRAIIRQEISEGNVQ